MAFLTSALFFPSIRTCLPRARTSRSSFNFIRRPRVAATGIRMTSTDTTPDPKTMTEEDWKAKLTKEEYYVLREKGTERPGTGEYDNFYPKSESYFACRACNNPLYSAESKFKSGCGWPAFDKCYKGSVRTVVDNSFGMRRVEILCGMYIARFYFIYIVYGIPLLYMYIFLTLYIYIFSELRWTSRSRL